MILMKWCSLASYKVSIGNNLNHKRHVNKSVCLAMLEMSLSKSKVIFFQVMAACCSREMFSSTLFFWSHLVIESYSSVFISGTVVSRLHMALTLTFKDHACSTELLLKFLTVKTV